MTWDLIPLSWRSYLKFLLECASITFAVAPLILFLRTNSFAGTPIFLSLFVISLVVMRIVEKEMYEVLRGMKRGTIWLKP